MKKFFRHLWWRINPPVNVRVFYRIVRNEDGFSEPFLKTMLLSHFGRMTIPERRFVLDQVGVKAVAALVIIATEESLGPCSWAEEAMS